MKPNCCVHESLRSEPWVLSLALGHSGCQSFCLVGRMSLVKGHSLVHWTKKESLLLEEAKEVTLR